MKKLILLLTAVFAIGTAQADSGLYYSQRDNGQGLSLARNGDTVVAFFFTYGGEEEEVLVMIPPFVSPSIILEEPLNGMRWFFISGDTLVDDVAEGPLYAGSGINFPQRLPPNGAGDVVAIGDYVLERCGDGWCLTVTHFEDSQLEPEDPVFGKHVFDTFLFPASD